MAALVGLVGNWFVTRDNLRDLGGRYERIRDWRVSHIQEHKAFDTILIKSGLEEVKLDYKVTDCRTTLRDLSARVRKCELNFSGIEFMRGSGAK